MALRAKGYTNRKNEKKLQVSGSVEEFKALLDKDNKAALKAFLATVSEAVK